MEINSFCISLSSVGSEINQPDFVLWCIFFVSHYLVKWKCMFIVLYSRTVVITALRNVPMLDSRLISSWLWKKTPVGNQAQSESDEAARETRSLLLVVYIVNCIVLCNWILMFLVHCGFSWTSCTQGRSNTVTSVFFLKKTLSISMHLIGIWLFYFALFNLCKIKLARHSKTKRWKQMEKGMRIWRKGALVSRIWRHPAALVLDYFVFSISCSAWSTTQIMVSEVLGMSLNNQLCIVVHLWPARTNSTNPTFRFNSLWFL